MSKSCECGEEVVTSSLKTGQFYSRKTWRNEVPSVAGRLAMKKSKFTEEQIAFALKQVGTGTKVPEICRETGISQITF